jgi:hypothetical protein
MWNLYDFVDTHGVNVIKEFTLGLQKRERARLRNRLGILERTGPDVGTGLLDGTHQKHIDKLKVTGQVTIRLMLCRGPINMDGEFTLLFGAFERDRRLVPANAEDRAEINRTEVIKNPSQRRCTHERIDR